MRKSIFRVSMLVLLSTILLSSQVLAASPQSIQVYAVPMTFEFDEIELKPPADQQGFIYNNSTYLPLRFVVHSLNQAVEWDNATSTVTIREPKSEDQLEIDTYNKNNQSTGSDKTSVAKPKLAATSIEIFIRKVTYKMNGETFVPEGGLEGFIVNDRLYVPLRFVSSSLGYEVSWDPTTYSVALQSPAFIAEKLKEPIEVIEEKLPVPVPPTSGGGGGGGVGSTQPTESSIITQAESQISALQSSCQNALYNIYNKFTAETDPTAQQALMSQGQSRLSQCDTEFDSIMSNLESNLSSYGYSTSIIAEYRATYAELKALAKAFLS